MRVIRMRKLILAVVIIVFSASFLMIYFMPTEEKPHFGVRSNKRPELLELGKLEPGKKVPVFERPSRKKTATKVKSERKDKFEKNQARQIDKEARQNGLEHLVDPKETKRKLLQDELPLLAPDWGCNDTYSTWQTESYCLPHHNVSDFFTRSHNRYCLKEGTAYVIKNGTECYCKPRWHGTFCSMPQVVYDSEYPRSTYAHLVTVPPRRLINALPFTQEFALLETRMREYDDVVDLYVILESNYTAAGHPRRRLLLERLKQGFLKEFHHKIFYVTLGYFPKKAYYNGWVADALLRNHISDQGLSRIKNLQENDVIVLNDADELPTREALLFLKLHRGYPEPIGFYLVHNVYGFYWIGQDKLSHAFGACSVGMLLHFFNWELYRLRSATAEMGDNKEDLNHFKYIHGGAISEWSFGKKATLTPGGWHCSWCFDPQGIKTKLEGAHWSDLPRWGAFPAKTTLEYIRNLTTKGLWFDDRTELLPPPSKKDEWFAPKYLKKHYKEYKYLLQNSNDVAILEPAMFMESQKGNSSNVSALKSTHSVKHPYFINRTRNVNDTFINR